jgi:hypothetical protein
VGEDLKGDQHTLIVLVQSAEDEADVEVGGEVAGASWRLYTMLRRWCHS